jgi:hypothetical protein
MRLNKIRDQGVNTSTRLLALSLVLGLEFSAPCPASHLLLHVLELYPIQHRSSSHEHSLAAVTRPSPLNLSLVLPPLSWQIPFLTHIGSRVRAGFAAEVCAPALARLLPGLFKPKVFSVMCQGCSKSYDQFCLGLLQHVHTTTHSKCALRLLHPCLICSFSLFQSCINILCCSQRFLSQIP